MRIEAIQRERKLSPGSSVRFSEKANADTTDDGGQLSAKRMLGILLSARLRYGFHGSKLEGDAAFLSKARELMREIGNKSKLPKLDSDLSRSSSAAHDTTGAGTPEAMDSAPGTEPVPEPEPAGVK